MRKETRAHFCFSKQIVMTECTTQDVFIKGKLSLEVDGDSKSLQYR